MNPPALRRAFLPYLLSPLGLCACSSDEPAAEAMAGTLPSRDAAAPEAMSDAGAAIDPYAELGPGCTDGDAAAPRTMPLREMGTLVGVAVAGHRLVSDDYAETAAREFNYVTPENEMKWDALEPSPGSFSFSSADSIVDFAVDHEMAVKGHTLVWHSQLPSWAEELSGEVTVREAMYRHIDAVVSHYRDEYPGRVVAWDVVNEAIDSQDGMAFYRESVFYRELGKGFIAEAFERARENDPNALLFYNDYGIEGLGPKSQATFEMIQELVEAEVPIDGIGFQMHTSAIPFGPSLAEFETNLARYAELGLRVNISEMDVTLCWGFESQEHALLGQRQRVNGLVLACLDNPACESITVWGVVDGVSWLNDHAPCEDPARSPSPLLFDDAYRRKPAWWGLSDAIRGCRTHLDDPGPAWQVEMP